MTFGQLKIDHETEADAAVLRVGGEVDLATVDVLVDAVEGAMPAEGTLVLDLTGVEFMDSAGIAAVNRCRRAATAAGVRLVLRCRTGGPVAQLMGWTGLDSLLDVELIDGPVAG